MDTSVEKRVIKVISRSKKNLTSDVTVDSTLTELGIDSIEGINLLFSLEEEFDITLPDEAKNLATVQEIIAGMELLFKEQEKSES